ncbi:hypothetical protein L1987_85936 [Smallanthus sonchifolius]|uniref:Uncharacterized protein n=1 Tax=Smallanthus sonchifolius TaxID=185202 RepID=A0ACB8XZ65_9ASTR|nr:hypothetical protein L1987_85936 [Smallanthus sonchifolius]
MTIAKVITAGTRNMVGVAAEAEVVAANLVVVVSAETKEGVHGGAENGCVSEGVHDGAEDGFKRRVPVGVDMVLRVLLAVDGE